MIESIENAEHVQVIRSLNDRECSYNFGNVRVVIRPFVIGFGIPPFDLTWIAIGKRLMPKIMGNALIVFSEYVKGAV